jgi:gamma-glutamyltranspeptidase/glutathione hydrolase
VWLEGDTYTRLNLASTLERIAKSNVTEFYEGDTAENLIRDMTMKGGIMTMQDLKNYK